MDLSANLGLVITAALARESQTRPSGVSKGTGEGTVEPAEENGTWVTVTAVVAVGRWSVRMSSGHATSSPTARVMVTSQMADADRQVHAPVRCTGCRPRDQDDGGRRRRNVLSSARGVFPIC